MSALRINLDVAQNSLLAFETAISKKQPKRRNLLAYWDYLMQSLFEIEYYRLRGETHITDSQLYHPPTDSLTIPLVAATGAQPEPAFIDWLADNPQADVTVPGNYQALLRHEKSRILAHRGDFKSDSDVAYLLDHFERAADMLMDAVEYGGWDIDVQELFDTAVAEGVEPDVAGAVMFFWPNQPVWKTLPPNVYKEGALDDN